MKQQTDQWFSTTGCACILKRTFTHRVSDGRVAQIRAYYPDEDEAAIHLNHLEESQQYDASDTSYDVIRACPEHAALDAQGIAAEFLKVEMTTRGTLFCKCQYVMRVTRPDGGEPVFEVGDHPVYTTVCPDHAHHRKADGRVSHLDHFHELKAEHDAVVKVKQDAAEALGILPDHVPVVMKRTTKAKKIVRTPEVEFAQLGIESADDYPALADAVQTLREATAGVMGLPPEEIQIQVTPAGLIPLLDHSTLLPKLIDARMAAMPTKKPAKKGK